jgi:hypothetical protein
LINAGETFYGKGLNPNQGGLMNRFVIIGGDAAGMSAASRAKRSQPDLTVTVFEKTRDVSYSA